MKKPTRPVFLSLSVLCAALNTAFAAEVSSFSEYRDLLRDARERKISSIVIRSGFGVSGPIDNVGEGEKPVVLPDTPFYISGHLLGEGKPVILGSGWRFFVPSVDNRLSAQLGSLGDLTFRNFTGSGVITVSNSATPLQIVDVVFDSNRNSRSGGAVSANLVGDFANNEFTNNSAIDPTTRRANGGGLLSTGMIGSFFNNKFTENVTSGSGGAVHVQGDIAQAIEMSTFTANAAGGSGGAVRTNSVAALRDSQFVDNTASYGGAVSASRINGHIANSTFSGNVAHNRGGAVDVFDLTGNIENSTFTENRAGGDEEDGYGGAVAANRIEGSIINSTFTGNRGGAVYVSEYLGAVENSRFIDNTTNRSGSTSDTGGLNAGELGRIVNSEFTGNRSNGFGAAVHVTEALTDGIADSTFTNNASQGGGAVYAYALAGGISNSTFTGNDATLGYSPTGGDRRGGAVYAGNLDFVRDSQFFSNLATTGGAAYFFGNSVPMTISDSTFLSNSAKGYAGALKTAGNVVVENSVFINNRAQGGTGGAIYHVNESQNFAPQPLTIRASGGGRTVFYGNQVKWERDDDTKYQYESVSMDTFDRDEETARLVIDAAKDSAVLMLDPIQASARVDVRKIGDGTWYLGGDSRMYRTSRTGTVADWHINGGELALTTVDYGAGPTAAAISTTWAIGTPINAATMNTSKDSRLMPPPQSGCSQGVRPRESTVRK